MGLCICQPWPVCLAHNLLLMLFKHPCEYTKLPHGFGTIPKRWNLIFVTGSLGSGWEQSVLQNRRTEKHEINMNPIAILTLSEPCYLFSNISWHLSPLIHSVPQWLRRQHNILNPLDTVGNNLCILTFIKNSVSNTALYLKESKATQ